MVALSEQERQAQERTIYKRFSRFLERHLPEGLYPRALIIIITPMVLFQSIVAFAFMERHWESVTKRLSRAVAQDISMLVDVYETYPHEKNYEQLIRMAKQRLDLSLSILPNAELPTEDVSPFFSLLDIKLGYQLRRRVERPYWLDTVGHSNYIDIRIKLDKVVFRIITERKRAYASSSHIFILWMVGTSLILLGVAVIFLRNQIRPILQLADAAQSFGMGRDVPDFRPRGALEVQSAAKAFLKMRERIERHVEQRTAMLAGVSHDLRTMLTRFKLQVAMLGEADEVRALQGDVDEMQNMLEGYMAFVRGDGGEPSQEVDVGAMLAELRDSATKDGAEVKLATRGNLTVNLKANAIKRCLANLLANACRFAAHVSITGQRQGRLLKIDVEDDGPGIARQHYEDVFRPFFRIDNARNQDTGGTGLGLAIARDIARSHGGDVTLAKSRLGGLKACLRIPV